MKMTGNFTGIKLDMRATKVRLKEELTAKLNELTGVWLTAVTGRVPVWSGMAQASLLKLSQLVDGQLIISPKGGVMSRIPLGKKLGTAKRKITKSDYIITITTAVPHYTLQEYEKAAHGGSPSAPWHSLAAGEQAFLAAATRIVLPNPVYVPVKKEF